MENTQFMSMKELAALVGWNERTVVNRLSKGNDMPVSIKIGCKRIFDRKSVIEWLKDHEENTAVNS